MWSFMTAAAVIAVLACPCLDRVMRAAAAPSDQTERNAEDTTFYRVPLTCAAARGLGCGSRAKPVLLDLQKKSIVREAWLNQTGEILAVVWKSGGVTTERESVIAAIADKHNVTMEELDSAERDAAIAGFRAGTGWHRGADVDQLSAQEAGVIASRLLHRAAATAPSVQGKITAVEPALTEAMRRLLMSACTSPRQCKDALLTAARPQLVKSELAALAKAIERGFTPIGDEQ